jgi:FkbM family methyltransferase
MFSLINVFRFIWSHPLARQQRIKTLGRIAAWQIMSRIHREVIVSWIADQKLAVRRGMTGATGNIYAGVHEFSDMMFLLHFLKSGDLFLDIGANVGTYTVLASGVCRAKTWAFEPDPETVLCLKRNIEINKLQELVTIHEFALGATEREVAFTVGLDTVNRVAVGNQPYRLVRQRPLDSFLSDVAPTFAKLDVEGYEEDILRGGQAFLGKRSLQAIELETITPGVLEMLSLHGFVRRFYDPFTRFLSTEPVGMQSCNALFIKNVSFVNSRIGQSPKVRVLDFLI